MKTTNVKKQIMLMLFKGMSKKEVIDVIATGSKLTKADAGRALDATIELIRKKLKVVFGGKGQISM